MSRAIERLSPAQVRNAKPKGKLSDGSPRRAVLLADGGNLYLQTSIGDNNSVRKSWVFRYRMPGQRTRDMGIGSLNTIGLAEARERAAGYRKLILDGIDPITHRNARVAQNLAADASVMSFDQAAEKYIRQHRAGWKSTVHATQWERTLKTYVSPIIGKLSVDSITTPVVLKVLEPIWQTKPVTASRLRGRVEKILGWAAATGLREGKHGEERPNPARWKGHLDALLVTPTKLKKVRPQVSLAYSEVPSLMTQLAGKPGMPALALQFVILTCVRTHDVLRAKWANIDLAARVWTIPEFSKVGGEHRIPLSNASVAVIERAHERVRMIGGVVAASPYLFPNDLTGAALSDNAMLEVLIRMNLKGSATVHGFRSSFRTFAQEKTTTPREVCEQALGHVVGSRVERSYARSDVLEKRRDLMALWSQFLTEPRASDKIVRLRG